MTDTTIKWKDIPWDALSNQEFLTVVQAVLEESGTVIARHQGGKTQQRP